MAKCNENLQDDGDGKHEGSSALKAPCSPVYCSPYALWILLSMAQLKLEE